MPYKSDAQRKFFHSPGAKKAGITTQQVKEFDSASKNKKLSKRIKNSKSDPMEMLKRGMQGKKK